MYCGCSVLRTKARKILFQQLITLKLKKMDFAGNNDATLRLKEEDHHKQLSLCTNRPAYRQGRKLTAVKVYTVNSESQHLFIYGVPKINLRFELKNLCMRYGQLLNIHVVEGYKTEAFTECFHVHYQRIQSARIAKRFLDSKSFYGSFLHVCYAPEYDTLQETQAKLHQRVKDVMCRLYPKQTFQNSANQHEMNNVAFHQNLETVEASSELEQTQQHDYPKELPDNLSHSSSRLIGPQIPNKCFKNISGERSTIDNPLESPSDVRILHYDRKDGNKAIVFRKRKITTD